MDANINKPASPPTTLQLTGVFDSYTLGSVHRTSIILIVLALLAVLLTGPVFELVDQWDNIPGTGNDTILSFVLLLTFAGALFAIRRFAVLTMKLLYLLEYRSTAPLQSISSVRLDAARFELDSGPLPSLFSLRI